MSDANKGLAVVVNRLSDDDLTVLDSTNLNAMFEAMQVVPETIDEYGTGFVVVQKETLVNLPFAIVEWVFSTGDHGEMVTVFAITNNGSKIIFNDGSTLGGIRAQLSRVTAMRAKSGKYTPDNIQRGIVANSGLKAREFMYDDVDSKGNVTQKPATVYSIA